MNQPVIIASFALALAATSPAGAQCRLCARPSTSVDELSDEGKVTVEIESSLSFDRLVLFGAGEGTAEIRPDGSRFAQGAIADIGPRAMVGTAITVNVTALLVPLGVVTVTFRAPVAAFAAIVNVAVSDVGPATFTALTVTPVPLTCTVV